MEKRYHIYWKLVVHIMSGAAAICAGKAIHALHQGLQVQKNKPQKSASQCPKSASQCPNCTHSHPPCHDNCSAQNAICKGCSKKGHWHAKCHTSGTASQQPITLDGAEKAPIIIAMERGRKLIWYKLTLNKHPHAMSCC